MSSSVRLRFDGGTVAPRVVLVEPEIPQNTGNVARLCAATGASLHLVGRLGFRIDDHAVRRAGLDYWHLVERHVWPDWATFVAHHPSARVRLFTAHATRSYLDAGLGLEDALVFGSETTGLPERILERHPDEQWAVPTRAGGVRSLNLANTVGIVLYEALRAGGALRVTRQEA